MKWKHFPVTGPLWGESTSHRWIPPQRASDMGFDAFFDVSLNQLLHKQLRADDLRRHDGHCDVTVMIMRQLPTSMKMLDFTQTSES